MRDYCILRLSLPAVLEAELRAELYCHPCLGLEFSAAGDRLEARAYFESEYPLQPLRDRIRAQWPQLVWEGETRIRLAAQTDPLLEPTLLTLLGKKIRLRGGPAFGSGAHPTTRLAAELLGRQDLAGKSLLDVGSGTGVLAILGKLRGAAAVTAVEILPEARANAAENFRLNGAGDIIQFRDLAEVIGEFDFVVANILSPTLIALADAIQSRLKGGGYLILSGVLKPERDSVLSAFSKLSLIEEREYEDWKALLLREASQIFPH